MLMLMLMFPGTCHSLHRRRSVHCYDFDNCAACWQLNTIQYNINILTVERLPRIIASVDRHDDHSLSTAIARCRSHRSTLFPVENPRLMSAILCLVNRSVFVSAGIVLVVVVLIQCWTTSAVDRTTITILPPDRLHCSRARASFDRFDGSGRACA